MPQSLAQPHICATRLESRKARRVGFDEQRSGEQSVARPRTSQLYCIGGDRPQLDSQQVHTASNVKSY